MENNETWRERFAAKFDSRFYGNPKLLPLNPDEITAFIAAELLTLADKIEKQRRIERYTLAAQLVVDEKNINLNVGLDTAISIIKEMVK